MGLVAVDVQRPRARHRPDDALRQAVRHRRERGLSGMRHPRRVGRHARQQAGQVDRPGMRAANRLSVAIPAERRSAPGQNAFGRGTIIVIWDEGRDEPWIILTDLPPKEAGASWREMRFRIETGFKALKSVGWQRRKTRRTDPALVERHRLVLSVATLLTLAFGSRAEDAQALKRNPSALRAPPKAAPAAQSHRGRISPWLDDAEPSSGKRAGCGAARAAAARTLTASAGRREGRLSPRPPKPAPVSPLRERAKVTRPSAAVAGEPRFSLQPPPSFPPFSPVIPAKAGIQSVAVSPDIRNQARTAASGSPSPFMGLQG